MHHQSTRSLQLFFILLLGLFMAPLLSAQPLTNQQVTAWEEDIDVMLSKLWQTYPEADDQLDRAQI